MQVVQPVYSELPRLREQSSLYVLISSYIYSLMDTVLYHTNKIVGEPVYAPLSITILYTSAVLQCIAHAQASGTVQDACAYYYYYYYAAVIGGHYTFILKYKIQVSLSE